jgi:hypothetical protein
MPKATLTFKLPDEQAEFTAATQAGDMRLVLWALDEYLRQQIKYCDHGPEIDAAYQAVRDKLREELESRNIALE